MHFTVYEQKGNPAIPFYTITHAPGLMKFTILVVDSFIIITISSVCLLDAQEKRRRFFQEKNIYFTVFTPKSRHLRIGGHAFYNFLSLSPPPLTDAKCQF